MCKERGYRALPKWAPETGVSHSYQLRPQRRAWNANAATTATKKAVCKHRSLSTPPLLGACAARHCQGPVIQGQLPQENTRHASGCCNVMLASSATGSPHIPSMTTVPLPLPGMSEQESPNQTWLYPPLVRVRNRCLRVPYTQRQGQNQSWNPGAVRTKKRKWNFSVQPQEQRIKSPQSTWWTLHLWNTWIDNECSQNWGSRLWEQLWTWGLLSASDLFLVFIFMLV